jgi:hypothetical protein
MCACKPVRLLGAAFLSVFLLLSAAEAKRIRYDIDGQTYSYDSSDREQASIAQHRIAAAKTADEARARARAERGASLWVRLFGSPIQTEADRAEAELKRMLATPLPRPRTAKPIAGNTSTKSKYLGSLGNGPPVISTTPPPPRPAAQTLPTAGQIEKPVSDPALSYPTFLAINREGIATADPEARAKLVERFRASALAEEQRRLEAAKRQNGGHPPDLISGGARVEPISTGSTGELTTPQVSSETSDSPRAKGLCGMIFFGLVSGC